MKTVEFVINDDDGCMDTPMFTGTDPLLWISKVERLFNCGCFSDDAKLDLVFLFLDGVALTWFMQEINKEKFMEWTVFKHRLLARFDLVKSCSSSARDSSCVPELVATESSIHDAESLGATANISFSETDSISELEAEAMESNKETDVVANPKVSISQLEPSLSVRICSESLDIRKDVPSVLLAEDRSQSTCVIVNNIAHQLFDAKFLSIRREKRLMKQSKFSKTWKFKFKNMAMSTNRSQMDHNIGLVRKKKRFQNLRMNKQAHMSRVMSKMRMLHDPRGMKQLLHGDKKLMFLCQVESGEATTLTLKEAVSELIFQGFKVLTAYPKVYGKLQLQNRLAMDIPEYAVSLTRVHAVNTIFQDRDATLMTWFIHGDAQFQVYHKWRSKPLLFWSLMCIQFVHNTKPATSLISRIHKESVNFHIGDPWSDCDLVVLIASKGVAATIGHSLYIMTYYSAYQVWDVMLQLGFRVHQLLKRPKLSISWKYKLKLMVIWLEDISLFHHSLGMGNKVVIGLYTRQKVQVRDHLWLTTNADLLLYLSANLIQVSLLQLHHTQCGLICRMVNWLIECELQGTNTR
ncbi:PREDICTED: uncharacterized protein LOC104767600 [Camelina sativa]|uniref:Uncharacterized protein LOC104767600 n=1 Tax=Camelina sativa TaxID=90675 RepID=A0ABM1RCM5_CAMSA|nr:PREDICTED: uncharacterized protein LOC104767600 [Camelina sativa]